MFTEEFLKSLPLQERLEMLRNNADHVEHDAEYTRDLTEEEVIIRKDELSTHSIAYSKLADQKKDAVKHFKNQMDPIASTIKGLLQEIKTGRVDVEGDLYHQLNHDTRYRETFDEEGNMIGQRKLRPDERQKGLFTVPTTSKAKEGTND